MMMISVFLEQAVRRVVEALLNPNSIREIR